MSLRIAAPLAASAFLVAALSLSACAGSSAAPTSTVAASSPAPVVTDQSSPSSTDEASGSSGCPTELTSGLASYSSSAAKLSEATSADLKYPGTIAGADSGCYIEVDLTSGTTKVKEVLAFVPGGKALVAQAKGDFVAAGYKLTSTTTGTYVKGTDVWIVSAADDSSSPFGTAFASAFPAGTVLLVHGGVG